jgi:hypothetical protein
MSIIPFVAYAEKRMTVGYAIASCKLTIAILVMLVLMTAPKAEFSSLRQGLTLAVSMRKNSPSPKRNAELSVPTTLPTDQSIIDGVQGGHWDMLKIPHHPTYFLSRCAWLASSMLATALRPKSTALRT